MLRKAGTNSIFLKDKKGAAIGQHDVRFEMRGSTRTFTEEEQYGMPPAAAANPGGEAMPKNTSFQPDPVEVKPGRNEVNFERLPTE